MKIHIFVKLRPDGLNSKIKKTLIATDKLFKIWVYLN